MHLCQSCSRMMSTRGARLPGAAGTEWRAAGTQLSRRIGSSSLAAAKGHLHVPLQRVCAYDGPLDEWTCA
jgi:hypothetical protein